MATKNPNEDEETIYYTSKIGDPQPAIDTLFEIVSLLLIQTYSSVNDINEKFNKCQPFLSQIIEPVFECASQITEVLDKFKYIHLSNSLFYCVNLFTDTNRIILQEPSNVIRVRAGVSAIYLYLSLFEINTKAGCDTVHKMRLIITNTLINFFKTSKELVDLMQSVINLEDEFPIETRCIYIHLYHKYCSLIKETSEKFKTTDDVDNIKDVGLCLRQCDHLYSILSSICFLMDNSKASEKIQSARKIISYYADVYKFAPETYRLTIEVEITNYFKDYCPLMRSFIDIISEQAANKGEQINNKIQNLKEQILSQFKMIESSIFLQLPFPIFDFPCCQRISLVYQNMSAALQDLLLSSKDVLVYSKEFNADRISQVKVMITSLTKLMTNIRFVSSFISELYYPPQLVVPNLIGLCLKNLNDKASGMIALIVANIASKSIDMTNVTVNLLNTLNQISEMMSTIDELKQPAKELCGMLFQYYFSYCFYAFKKEDEIHKIKSDLVKFGEILNNSQLVYEAIYKKLTDESVDFAKKNSFLFADARNDDENENKNASITILDGDQLNDFKVIEEIGSGGGGKVLKVENKNVIYAMKVMNVSNKSEENIIAFRHFIKEYEIMNMLNHPNILKTFGIFLSDENNRPSILLEFCPINLNDLITKKNSLSNVQIVCTIYQIIEGMKYVHFQKIIHRDLKPSNILITKDGTVKICDFGISQLMTTEQQLTTCGIGTQKFMAPEIINEEDYDEKVDVYSFGVLVFAILNNGNLPVIKIRDICNGKKAEIPNTFTQFSKELINSCWNFEAGDRPSFGKILIDLATNKYNLVELNELELLEVESFVKIHKTKIPEYCI